MTNANAYTRIMCTNRHYGFYKGRQPGILNASQTFDAERERCQGSHDNLKQRNRTRVPCSKSDMLENGLNKLCLRYGVSCVSQRNAILEGFLRQSVTVSTFKTSLETACTPCTAVVASTS